MYVFLFGLTLYIWWIERADWMCPSLHSYPSECDGNGMPYRDSKPEPKDTCQKLIERIHNAAGAERKSIKWRRSLIIAVGSALTLWLLLLTPGSLPKWTKFYLSAGIIFVIVRAQFAWYSYHRFKIPEQNIYKALDSLNLRCL